MNPLRIAIISFEHMHAMSYAQSFPHLKGAVLCAIVEDDETRLAKIKDALAAGPTYYACWREMISTENPDAVMICTANCRHAEIAIECAKKGIHILTEKPIATTIADGEAMIKAAAEADVRLMTAFPVRYAPEIRKTKEMIESGTFGSILGGVTSNHGSMPGGWFVQPELSGGGAVLDHTVHVIDVLRWILDDEVESVYAEYAKRLHDIPCEDCGQLSVKFKKGTIISLDTSWSRPPAYSAWGDVKIELKGDKGNISLNCFPRAINLYENSTMSHTSSSPVAELDLLMVQEFVDCINEKREPLTSGLDGLRATEVALLAYQAGRELKPVAI